MKPRDHATRPCPCEGSRHLRLELPAEAAMLVVACKSVRSFAESCGLGPRECDRLELAVDEVCTNCVTHAYERDADRRYWVTMEFLHDESQLVVRVYDTGPAFEPADVPAPNTSCELSQRQIGGLGLFLAAKGADSIGYQRTERGENCVVLRKYVAAAAAEAAGA
ncbi:MAG: ATP-binding protein [Candidatus Sumerlaeia bacterium]|nr:ATP-binding protein [Candidatus Sumerlaeia bacterium]